MNMFFKGAMCSILELKVLLLNYDSDHGRDTLNITSGDLFNICLFDETVSDS